MEIIMKLRLDEVDTIITAFEEFVEAVQFNTTRPDVEAYTALIKKRDNLKETIRDLIGIKEEPEVMEEPKPVLEDVECPDCGSRMISRKNSKNGDMFWGCSKYPKCRGTRDSEGKSREDREKEKREQPIAIDERYRFRRG